MRERFGPAMASETVDVGHPRFFRLRLRSGALVETDSNGAVGFVSP